MSNEEHTELLTVLGRIATAFETQNMLNERWHKEDMARLEHLEQEALALRQLDLQRLLKDWKEEKNSIQEKGESGVTP